MDENITPAAEQYANLMEMVEAMQTLVNFSKTIEKIPFEDLNRSTWAKVQQSQRSMQMVLGMIVEMVPNAAKVIGNEAAYAHLNAVMTAD